MRVVVRDHRSEHGDLVGQLGRPRHEFANKQPGRFGGNRTERTTDFFRGLRLGIPCLVLRRPAPEKHHDHRLRSTECRPRGAHRLSGRETAHPDRCGAKTGPAEEPISARQMATVNRLREFPYPRHVSRSAYSRSPHRILQMHISLALAILILHLINQYTKDSCESMNFQKIGLTQVQARLCVADALSFAKAWFRGGMQGM